MRLLVNKHNLGYAAGNNIGIRMARGRHILLLNSDIELKENAPEMMCDVLEKDDTIGAVAARLIGSDGSLQKSCRQLPDMATLFLYDIDRNKILRQTAAIREYRMRDFDHSTSRDVEQPPAACLMITRKIVEEVGVLDERFFLFFNDVDFCRRIIDKGYRIRYLAEAEAIHHEGRSVIRSSSYRVEWHVARYRYYSKWHGPLAGLAAKLVSTFVAVEELFLILVLRVFPPKEEERQGAKRPWRGVFDMLKLVWKEK